MSTKEKAARFVFHLVYWTAAGIVVGLVYAFVSFRVWPIENFTGPFDVFRTDRGFLAEATAMGILVGSFFGFTAGAVSAVTSPSVSIYRKVIFTFIVSLCALPFAFFGPGGAIVMAPIVCVIVLVVDFTEHISNRDYSGCTAQRCAKTGGGGPDILSVTSSFSEGTDSSS